MSKENLISLADRSPEERREIASMGGKAASQKYHDEVKLQKIAQAILRAKLPKGELHDLLIAAGISPAGATRGAGMLMKLTERVINDGDVRAFEAVRDTAGEKPSIDLTSGGEPITGIDIAFVKCNKEENA